MFASRIGRQIIPRPVRKLYMECPRCGNQELLDINNIIVRFDTRLTDPSYHRALKGGYHTWTCERCHNKFIRSNQLCDCGQEGLIIKAEAPKLHVLSVSGTKCVVNLAP